MCRQSYPHIQNIFINLCLHTVVSILIVIPNFRKKFIKASDYMSQHYKI